MRGSTSLRAPIALAAGLVALAMLGGCGSDLLGSPEEPPLEGERISVLEQDQIFNANSEVAGIPVTLPPASSNPEWPQAGGYPSHAMQHLALGITPQIAWQTSIGVGGDAGRPLVSEPVSAGGRIFALDAASNVTALDLATGDTLWRLDLTPAGEDELFGGGLATDGSRVFATTHFGIVYAIDASSGQVLWSARLEAPIRAAPALADGILIVVTVDNRAIALDAGSGEVLWTHSGPITSASLLGNAAPAIADGIAIVAYSTGDFFAIDIATGQAIWSDTIARRLVRESATKVSGITGRMVIDQGLVMISGNGSGTAAMELRNGLRAWEIALPSATGPWIAGDFLYLITIDQKLVCLTRDGGRIRWYLDLPRYLDPEDRSGPISWNGPVLAGDRLLMVSSEGQLLTVSPYTGEALGSGTLPAGSRVPPILVDGGLYLLLGNATLVALR